MFAISNDIFIRFPSFINCKKVIFLEYPIYSTILYFYGPLSSSAIKLPQILNVKLYSNSIICLAIFPYAAWPLNHLQSLPKLFSKLILRRLQGC